MGRGGGEGGLLVCIMVLLGAQCFTEFKNLLLTKGSADIASFSISRKGE